MSNTIDLRMTLVQSDLHWEDCEANLSHLDTHLNSINEPTDVVVLCEMFTTGFSMQPDRIAEKHDAENMRTLNWMRSWAKKLDAVITGSVSVNEEGTHYNRLYWVLPDGRINTYDKRHTFTFAGEDKHYAKGYSRIIEEWRGWRICPLICYDLRFPVWSRNTLVGGEPAYDLLLYVANWPEARRAPWQKLLLARAIENQCYVCAVNRVGTDANGNVYSGDSAAIDPRGEYLAHFNNGIEHVHTQALSRVALDDFREKFPVLRDSDFFTLSHLPDDKI
jgi:predicted amidohydrolase